MMNWLVNRLVAPNSDDPQAAKRSAQGKAAGLVGIASNTLLFIIKLVVGLLTGGLAVLADAFNNLSDAASSVVTLLGFRLAESPADGQHPFGHGRMEYLSSLLLSFLILLAGVELGKSSLEKCFHPTDTVFTWISFVLLGLAVLVKLWMMIFYRRIGKQIDSETLLAAAADSRNDVICTSLVIVAAVVEKTTGWRVDGAMGLLVAALIVWTGVSVLRDSISPLLGQAPEPALVRDIRETVLSYPGIVGVHDLMVHNYGPGRMIISLHAEVPAQSGMLESHDLIDNIEQDMKKKFHAITCIHMDPVSSDEHIVHLRQLTETVIADIDSSLTMHDFRVVFGDTHTNLIFDLVTPFSFALSPADLIAEIQRRLAVVDPTLCVVAQIEHAMTGEK